MAYRSARLSVHLTEVMDRPFCLPDGPGRAFLAMTDHQSCLNFQGLLRSSTIQREHRRRLFSLPPEFVLYRATLSDCARCDETFWRAKSPASRGAFSILVQALPLRRAAQFRSRALALDRVRRRFFGESRGTFAASILVGVVKSEPYRVHAVVSVLSA